MYDNDHERKHEVTGNIIPPGGYNGMKRVASFVAPVAADTLYLKWAELAAVMPADDRWNPHLPTGTDVRDYLSRS